MPNYHCVLDTCALLKRYKTETGTPRIDELFEYKDCARHILNITIPEIMAVFLSWQLKGELPQTRSKNIKELRKNFREDKEQRKFIVHNVDSYNISRSNSIYDISFGIPPSTYKNEQGKLCTKERIGPIDVLVLSVCESLKKDYKKAYLFTSDEHMFKVAEKMGIDVYDPEKISRLPFPNSR